MMHHVSLVNSSLLLNCITLYGYTVRCLSIHKLMGFPKLIDFGFQFLAITNAAIKICMQSYMWKCFSLWKIQMSVIAGLYGSFMLNTLRNYQTIFQSGCTILLSHHHCMIIPLLPYLCQYLLF